MSKGAPRLPWCPLSGIVRGVWLMLCAWLAWQGPVAAEEITEAEYFAPTRHYAHGVLGDAVEYSGLRVWTASGTSFEMRHPAQGRVFEDIEPRLWDVTDNGVPEIVVIETDPPQGAQLAVYAVTGGALSKIAATPHIGQTNRWLGPIAAADFDGDGHIEIAYVDRPHLAKTLRIWRYKDGTLTEIVNLLGVTNHRIGEPDIAGGIRTCGTGPEIIVADAGWRRLLAVTFDGTALSSTDIGPHRGRDSFAQAMGCKAAK